MFRPTQDALIARHVGTIELGLHAHQRYLERHGTPRSVSDLQHHALIGFDRETAFIRQMQPRFKGFTREQFALRADSDLAQIAATRAGLGIGVMHAPLAAQNAQLSRVLPRQFAVPLDTWIVMHHDLRDSPRCAVTFAALAEGLSGYITGASQPGT
ncbi:hypothetical protein SDC9_128586 [bioreactor metagenome]|uniref:LysR substrate-binding domain-containing protein n=1 Tax=bioreactor metagenome TaxID=1076179 RepID=A0A645CXW1_9ZZZZ